MFRWHRTEMRLSKKFGVVLAGIIIVAAGAIRYLFVVPVGEPPTLHGSLQQGELFIDGRVRTFSYYLPARRSA